MINLINIKIIYPKLKLDIILRKLLNNSIILSRHTSIYLSFSLHNLNPFILKIFLPVIILLPNLSRNITRPSCRLWDFHVVSKLQDTLSSFNPRSTTRDCCCLDEQLPTGGRLFPRWFCSLPSPNTWINGVFWISSSLSLSSFRCSFHFVILTRSR